MELKDMWPLINEVISTGGEFRMAPHGNSMLPLIRPNIDEVVLVAPNNLKKHDIVLFRRDDGKFVLHRLMLIKKDEYLMCGDNQRFYETDIKSENILAKVKSIYRDGVLVDLESKEYKKYVKCFARQVARADFRLKLSILKCKIFGKKKTTN